MVLRQYMDIQKARFTDRLQLKMSIDESCLHVDIPGLTLRPIIENAVNYAVEPREEGGVIWFRIQDGNDCVIIEVEDDGPGIEESKIKQILQGQFTQTDGKTTGIGFTNVVRRLRLLYGYEDIMNIESV